MRREKKRWGTPEVRSYGTFEAATMGCDKVYGSTDGYTFMGADIVCAAS